MTLQEAYDRVVEMIERPDEQIVLIKHENPLQPWTRWLVIVMGPSIKPNSSFIPEIIIEIYQSSDGVVTIRLPNDSTFFLKTEIHRLNVP